MSIFQPTDNSYMQKFFCTLYEGGPFSSSCKCEATKHVCCTRRLFCRPWLAVQATARLLRTHSPLAPLLHGTSRACRSCCHISCSCAVTAFQPQHGTERMQADAWTIPAETFRLMSRRRMGREGVPAPRTRHCYGGLHPSLQRGPHHWRWQRHEGHHWPQRCCPRPQVLRPEGQALRCSRPLPASPGQHLRLPCQALWLRRHLLQRLDRQKRSPSAERQHHRLGRKKALQPATLHCLWPL